MPKVLYLKLNLSSDEITNYKEKLESEYNIKNIYPEAKDLKQLQPITSTDDNSNYSKLNLEPLGAGTFNNQVAVISHTETSYYSIYDDKIVEQDTIYQLKNQFNFNDISNVFFKHFTAKNFTVNTVCWWCCYELELGTIPIPLPIKYYPKRHDADYTTKKFGNTNTFKIEYTRRDIPNDKFLCKGLFCSFNCCLAYARYQKQGDIPLIHYMYKKMNGSIKVLNCAPPREILQKFGGLVDIHSYRNSFDKPNAYELLEYPVIFYASELRQKAIKNLFMKESKPPELNNETSTFTDTDTGTSKKKRKGKSKSKSILSMLNIDIS